PAKRRPWRAKGILIMHLSTSSVRKVFTVTLVFFALCGSAWAQTAGGTILGRMMDASGAVIPNARVVIKNVATAVTREVTTNDAGLYQAPNLSPGAYEITANAPGFGPTVVSNVLLNIGAELPVDLPMKVGTVGQQVVVDATRAQIELASSEMSQVVATKTIVE